jgi:Ca-activated chloride channel homolog
LKKQVIKRVQSVITFGTLILHFGVSIADGQKHEPEQKAETIRVDTSLVTVPVIVTDSVGRFVTGLTRSDFQIFEDGKPQEISSFSATEAPFNVALIIDSSSSTQYWLDTIRKAALSFVKQLQTQDRVLIVTVDERVNFHGDFTSDRHELQRKINSIKSNYLTAIYDGISQTISEKLTPIKGRKAIVAFTDGIDTFSKQSSCESTLDLALHSGVLVYIVQYGGISEGISINSPCMVPGQNLPPSLSDLQVRQRLGRERQIIATSFLQVLAEQSGARKLRAGNIENLRRAFALIADELRHQYTLGYYSTYNQQDGSYRTISVRLKRPDLAVRARQGYRALKAESQIKKDQD